MISQMNLPERPVSYQFMGRIDVIRHRYIQDQRTRSLWGMLALLMGGWLVDEQTSLGQVDVQKMAGIGWSIFPFYIELHMKVRTRYMWGMYSRRGVSRVDGLGETAQCRAVRDILELKCDSGGGRISLSLMYSSQGQQLTNRFHSIVFWVAPIEMLVGLDVARMNGA